MMERAATDAWPPFLLRHPIIANFAAVMAAAQKTYQDKTLGKVTVKKSQKAKLVSIKISPTAGIIVTIPSWASWDTGVAFLVQKKEWVLAKWLQLQASLAASGDDIPDEKEIERLRSEAKEELPPRLQALAEKYGFSYAGLTVKNNRSNWGSCSAKKHINLNLRLVRLPGEERDYVMLHELCHLRHLDHGTEFRSLLDSLCLEETGLGSRELEKRLRSHLLL